MNKEIGILLKEVKELKLYYVQAKDTGNVELEDHFKQEIEEKMKKIRVLQEKEEKMAEIRKKKKELKNKTDKDEEVVSQSDKIRLLEKKVEEERKRKLIEEKKLKKDREIKRKEIERAKNIKREEGKEEERLRRKAKLKELKFGTIFISLLLFILFVLMILRGTISVESENMINRTFNNVFFRISRLYSLAVLLTILVYTYVQTNIKNILLIKVYSVVSLFVAFLSFGGIAYAFKNFLDFNFKTYFVIPEILVLILLFIFIRLSYRNKLEYQYVKKYYNEEEYED